jgi:hypothetical protein
MHMHMHAASTRPASSTAWLTAARACLSISGSTSKLDACHLGWHCRQLTIQALQWLPHIRQLHHVATFAGQARLDVGADICARQHEAAAVH